VKAQRLRVRFARGEEVKYITHLDLMRLWERTLRRANIDVACSEGFTPRPRMSLAAPLAVGVTSSGELLDIFLNTRMTPQQFIEEVDKQLPSGIELLEAREMGLRAPSAQSDVRWAEYDVVLPAMECDAVTEATERFLAADSLPWEQLRDKDIRKYDIRALVQELWLEPRRNPSPEGPVVGMRLRADSGGSGRPEQVTAAMGLPEPLSIHRRKLILAETSPAHEAWRRLGQFT